MKRFSPRLFLFLAGLCALSARAQTVVQNITYTSTTTVVGPATIVADTNVTVSSGADVTFRASGSVTLGTGFTASSGSAFHALIVGPPVIISSTSASGMVGAAFSYTIVADNSPVSFNATSLPSGLSVNTSTGTISGTPTTAGTSSVSLSATNTSGTGTATLTLAISPITPVINSPTSANGTVGVPFSYFITAANVPTSFNATGLPGGLGVNTSTGLISGTPTATGTSSISLSAANTAGTGPATLTLTIGAFSSDTSDQNELNLHLPLVP